jgi:hypothetical protein
MRWLHAGNVSICLCIWRVPQCHTARTVPLCHTVRTVYSVPHCTYSFLSATLYVKPDDGSICEPKNAMRQTKLSTATFNCTCMCHSKVNIYNDFTAAPSLQNHNFTHSQCSQSMGNKSLSVRQCVMPWVPTKRHRHTGILITVSERVNQIARLDRTVTGCFSVYTMYKSVIIYLRYIQLNSSDLTSAQYSRSNDNNHNTWKQPFLFS